MRTDAILSSLNHEQLAEIYDWIATDGCAATQRRLAEPPPSGLALKGHLSTLRRYYMAERRQRQTRILLESRVETAIASDPESLLKEAKVNLAEPAQNSKHSIRRGSGRESAQTQTPLIGAHQSAIALAPEERTCRPGALSGRCHLLRFGP